MTILGHHSGDHETTISTCKLKCSPLLPLPKY